LLLGGTSGNGWGWSSPRTIGSLGLGTALLGWFGLNEARRDDPMLKLSLFQDRTFVVGVVGSFFAYAALFVGTTALPFFLVRSQGRSLTSAGILVGIVPVTMSIVAPFAGRLADRWGSRWPCTVALVCLAASFVLIAFEGRAISTWLLALSMLLAGAGVGGFEAPNDLGVLKAIPSDDLGIGTAMLSTARNLGMTAGVAVAATMLDIALARPFGTPAERVTAGVVHGLLVGVSSAVLGAVFSLLRRH
jgi:MFS transporter, DHA2 family, lincomycin resistance protein